MNDQWPNLNDQRMTKANDQLVIRHWFIGHLLVIGPWTLGLWTSAIYADEGINTEHESPRIARIFTNKDKSIPSFHSWRFVKIRADSCSVIYLPSLHADAVFTRWPTFSLGAGTAVSQLAAIVPPSMYWPVSHNVTGRWAVVSRRSLITASAFSFAWTK